MKYIFIKVVRKPPFSYFLKCLTEGNAKKPSFRDSLGNFLDFSRFPFKTDKTEQIYRQTEQISSSNCMINSSENSKSNSN